MSDAQLDQLWFQVGRLKPRLRGHIQVHRQQYRDRIWYVYQDKASNRYHRFNEAAHRFLGFLDGEKTVQWIHETLTKRNAENAPDREEIIQLLSQLHRVDLIQTANQADTNEIYKRLLQHKRKRLRGFMRNPVSFRLPLFDPEAFLTRTITLVNPVFNRVGLALWTVITLVSLFLVVSYWPELSRHASEQLLVPKNILLLVFLYPAIKLLHELAHAYCVKLWGGEVHDMGIIFVLLLPIPYVDASGASVFKYKHQRMLVGAAGILMEVLIACIALFVWLGVEPGLVRTVAFNVMVIGGISTLLFNGNPLLRYDGYYVLTDAIAIPNLASRSVQYLGYLFQRYCFGFDDKVSPACSIKERLWYVVYAPAAFVYRMVILFVIILLVADKFFLVGMLLGAWLVLQQILLPLARICTASARHPQSYLNRWRIITVNFILLGLLVSLLLVYPFPSTTNAQGVIWLPENSRVYAKASGFVTNVVAQPGESLSPNDVLLQLENPLLDTEIEILEAKLQELKAQYAATWRSKRVENNMIKEQIVSLEADLKTSREEKASLTTRSDKSGIVVLPDADALVGKYFNKGDFIAYVTDPKTTKARVVVPQDAMGLIPNTDKISIKVTGNINQSVVIDTFRILPETTDQLPSAVLGTKGGGVIPVDPLDSTGRKAVEKFMQIELDLETDRHNAFIGKRIHVKFSHGDATLGQQWYRSLQQLLLRRFNV